MRAAFFCRSRVASNPQSGQERPPFFGAFAAPGQGSLLPAARSNSRRSRATIARGSDRGLDVESVGGMGACLSTRRSLRFASRVVGRSHDCDAAERIEIEEIFVAGHDHVRAAVYGRVEELVVPRVTRRPNVLQHFDDFDERSDTLEQCLASLTTNVAIELR